MGKQKHHTLRLLNVLIEGESKQAAILGTSTSATFVWNATIDQLSQRT